MWEEIAAEENRAWTFPHDRLEELVVTVHLSVKVRNEEAAAAHRAMTTRRVSPSMV
jgi:hypothetical protein